MLTWIISTAQQARPKVIHHRLPVRAHWNKSSVEVTRNPLSATSLWSSPKKCGSGGWRSEGRSFSCRGSGSLPFERPLLPGVDEAEDQLDQEQHHRAPADQADLAQRHRPGKQEGRLEVEDDEQDRDEVEAHVELAPAVLEGRKAAFIFGELVRIGVRSAGQLG